MATNDQPRNEVDGNKPEARGHLIRTGHKLTGYYVPTADAGIVRLVRTCACADKFREGERVKDSAGNRGTVYTDEAGGFVRVRFDRYDNDPLMTDTLVDVSKLRRIK